MTEKFEKLSSFYQEKNGAWQSKECVFKLISSQNNKQTKVLAEKKFDLATCAGIKKSLQLDMGNGFSMSISLNIQPADAVKHADLFKNYDENASIAIASSIQNTDNLKLTNLVQQVNVNETPEVQIIDDPKELLNEGR